MEKKLISIIMNPSAIITIITGILLYCINIDVYNNFYWIYIKILCVLLILIFHIYLEKTRKKLFSGIFKHSQKYYAFINEIPTILMVIILYMAVVKPF
jgi:putative membrane protein